MGWMVMGCVVKVKTNRVNRFVSSVGSGEVWVL